MAVGLRVGRPTERVTVAAHPPKEGAMTVCLKCGASATPETRDSEEPLCWAHGGGEPPEVEREL